MIKIDFYQNGYIVSGHANYHNENDVVCAGVSSIVIGSLNWYQPNDVEIQMDSGLVSVKFKQNIDQCLKYQELIKTQLESIAINPDYKKHLKITMINSLL